MLEVEVPQGMQVSEGVYSPEQDSEEALDLLRDTRWGSVQSGPGPSAEWQVWSGGVLGMCGKQSAREPTASSASLEALQGGEALVSLC